VDSRLDAIQTLGRFGPKAGKAVPALREALKDEEPRVRAASALALGKMELEGAEAVPDLLQALRDKKLEVQAQVVTALMLLTAAGVPGLREKVSQADRRGRWASPVARAPAVVEIRDQDPLPFLVKEVADKDPRVRTQAALALAELGAKALPAVPALLRALENEDPQVRLTISLVIARIQRKPAEMAKLLKDIRERYALVVLQARERLSLPMKMAEEQLHAQFLRMAMQNPAVQAQARQIVVSFIMTKAGPNRGGVPGDKELEHLLDGLGPESIPALVEGLNFTAANQIGFC
jgi:HEAT repeat protein